MALIIAGRCGEIHLNCKSAARFISLSGVKTDKSDVALMAAASGDQVARYVSGLFAKQGWIRQDQLRKARMVY